MDGALTNTGKSRPVLVRSRPNAVYFVLCLILILVGTIMLFSASSAYAETAGEELSGTVRSHIIHLLIGGAAFAGCILFVTPALSRRVTYFVLPVSLLLLVAVLAIGVADGVARRWMVLGPLQFQPSEMAKTVLIMTLALYFSVTSDERDPGKSGFWKRALFGFVIPLAVTGVFCLLVMLEKHLSGTVIMMAIGMVMIFFSGTPLYWFLSLLPIGAGGYFVAVSVDYTRKRIESWLHRGADTAGSDWQTTQGIYAIGSGGLFGRGFGESKLKYGYVSEVTNDFIFTVVCEELGFFGAVAIMLLFLALILRGLLLGLRCRDRYVSLMILGLTCKLGLHVALNILVVTGIAPNTGVSLPFFSSGGSATLMQMVDAGLLLGLSRYCEP